MTSYSTLPDNELTVFLRQGDDVAFAELYKRYKSGIYIFVKKFVHSSALAEDLTQEILVKIWEAGDKLKDIQSLRAYLFITARNHTLNNLKKAFRANIAMAEVVNNIEEQRNNIEEDLISKEYTEYLQSVLATLPGRSRDIFKLCREQGKTYDEAAHAMGISRNAIKNHMVSTMKILSASVEKDLGISLSLLLAVILK
jgi:RNA polymerase sigma-70 factor (family 1)